MTRPRASVPVDSVVVIVPARDEEATIAELLQSVRRALDNVAARITHQSVVLVADGCKDATVTAARDAWGHDARLRILECAPSGPGFARDLGYRTSLSGAVGSRGRTMYATTDADGVVPDTWLMHHARRLDAGFDAVAGTIALKPLTPEDPAHASERRGDRMSGRLRRAAHERLVRRYDEVLAHSRVRWGQHTDVFAANLAIRGSVLDRVNGFPHLAVGEDHAVWDAARRVGSQTRATDVVDRPHECAPAWSREWRPRRHPRRTVRMRRERGPSAASSAR